MNEDHEEDEPVSTYQSIQMNPETPKAEPENPPAFPTPEIVQQFDDRARVWPAQPGMALRDYFAAKRRCRPK